jgi:hypothetical protein
VAGSRRRTLLIVLLLVALGLAGARLWQTTRLPYERGFCTLAGTVGGPVASTPEGAFEAWWADKGPEAALTPVEIDGDAIAAGPPSRDDLERTAEHEWEWRYAQDGSVIVTVNPAEMGEGWQVGGVNACGYAPSDEVPG